MNEAGEFVEKGSFVLMRKVLVIAPHPDDETLGCGGTLLKHRANGDEIYWLIVTSISEEQGFHIDRINSRQIEIDNVAMRYGFQSVYQLNWPTMKLDEIPMSRLVQSFSNVIQEVQPEIVYVPFRDDIHSDHKYVFDAAAACTKWFRYPFIKRVLAYETVSETEFGINPMIGAFKPNVFINIAEHVNDKWEIMKIFETEIGVFPFPRSRESIEALSRHRGSASGFNAAEAFMLLKEVIE